MNEVHSLAELRQRAEEQDLPLEALRFFLGADVPTPQSFGIFRDEQTGDWVVYKNRADGRRVERYRGPDEARAAQELWTKLNSEYRLRRSSLPGASMSDILREESERRKRNNLLLLVLILIVCLLLPFLNRWFGPRRGYYLTDGELYYYQLSDWFHWEEAGWAPYEAPAARGWYRSAAYSATCPDAGTYAAFEDSGYYVPDGDG